MLKVWYSDESFAQYLIDHVPALLKAERDGSLGRARLVESDALRPGEFHRIPTHLKQILYLDAPDVVIERDNKPIASVEISTEAGTGHDVFQRFGRIAAAVERGVPALYVFPEGVWIPRRDRSGWDSLNPLIFRTLERLMTLYGVPALLHYYPTEYRTRCPEAPNGSDRGHVFDPSSTYAHHPDSGDGEMQALFEGLELIVSRALAGTVTPTLANERLFQGRREWMQAEFVRKGGADTRLSPETATKTVPSTAIVEYIQDCLHTQYVPGGFFAEREETVIYCVDSKEVRADPYVGALAALDYLMCRVGRTFEDRDRNLAIAWGNVSSENGHLTVQSKKGNSVTKFTDPVKGLYSEPRKVLLGKAYSELKPKEIPRYLMQVRWGTAFTKRKEIRMLAYFADAILFEDGALWREG